MRWEARFLRPGLAVVAGWSAGPALAAQCRRAAASAVGVGPPAEASLRPAAISRWRAARRVARGVGAGRRARRTCVRARCGGPQRWDGPRPGPDRRPPGPRRQQADRDRLDSCGCRRPPPPVPYSVRVRVPRSLPRRLICAVVACVTRGHGGALALRHRRAPPADRSRAPVARAVASSTQLGWPALLRRAPTRCRRSAPTCTPRPATAATRACTATCSSITTPSRTCSCRARTSR